MRTLSMLIALASFAVPSGATAQTELVDAQARLRERRNPAPDLLELRAIAAYTGEPTARVGLVQNAAGRMWVIARSSTPAGERIDVAPVIGAQPDTGAAVRVVSQRHRLFAVEYASVSPPPDASPCACTAPPRIRGVQWFRIADDASVHRVLTYDAGQGAATWEDATRTATVIERSGPVRCPPGCPPAPAIQLIHTRVYGLRGDRLVEVSQSTESVYTG